MERSRRSVLALAPGALACAAGRAAAQTVGRAQADSKTKVQLFNIPAQPLGAAILAYSNVVGNQVIYDSRLAMNRRSSPVVGLFTPETALRMLLGSADLTIHYTSSRDVTLVPAFEAPRAGRDPDNGRIVSESSLSLDTLYVELPPGADKRPDFSAYGQAVRVEIKRALARSGETAHRTVNVQIELWVDEAGHVRRSRITRSSGQADLDAAIQRVLGAVVFKDPPPPAMPQPVRVTILGV
ncbi:MAG TPA: TonB family protein [Caulobacteraceae bacterium]|jgi:TonB family protein|nr:TonB family protein [Caulobacteraceae bacterium]